ncbi:MULTISPECIES: hypothetical protein [unclassified Bradyrhizobium]|nr:MULTISPECIES: hypothetical protein [unclassified Bradyrhizobium]
MRAIVVGSVLATLCGGSQSALAADQLVACDSVLVKDTFVDRSNLNLALAISNTVDQKTFDSVSNSAGVKLSIPVGDDDLKFDGDWKKYTERRIELNKRYHYNYSQTISRDVAISSTQTAAIDAWSKCIENSVQETLVLRTSFLSANKVAVDAYWKAGAEGKPGVTANVQLVGAKPINPIPRQFAQKWTSLLFERSRSDPFYLAINIRNGTRGVLSLPAETQPVTCRDCKTQEAVKLQAGHFGPGKSPKEAVTERLKPGTYLVVVTTTIQGIGDGGYGCRPVFKYTITPANEDSSAVSIGRGGDALFSDEIRAPYSGSTKVHLNRDGKIVVGLQVNMSFNRYGTDNIDGANFGESEITFARLD